MKRNLIIIALAALLLPALLRGLWFYRGVAERPAFATPDYAALSAPQAPVHPTDNAPVNDSHAGNIVLLDAAHGNQFTMSEIESFTESIKLRGGQVELHNDAISLEHKLKYTSAFVSFSPFLSYSAEEIRILKNFAARGGRILVFSDATRNAIYVDLISGNPVAYSDANGANSLLASFGISINNDYLYNLEKNEGNFRNVFFDDFGKNELTFGLKEVAFYGTHSVESPSGLILFRGTESTLSSVNDANDPAQGGAALNADGNVAAFGDLTFLSSPYNTYADNASFIANLADFALAGKQTISLANFPFVFNGRTVQVYLDPQIIMTAELVQALGKTQASLRFLNIEIEFVSKYPDDGDAIVISSLEPGEDFTPLINKFDLTEGSSSEFVNVPGFGDVGIYGNALVLLNPSDKGNTLALFAGNIEDTISLLGTLNSGSLSSCLLHENTAVCSVGFGGSYEEKSNGEPQATPDGESTPQPEGTPTPSG